MVMTKVYKHPELNQIGRQSAMQLQQPRGMLQQQTSTPLDKKPKQQEYSAKRKFALTQSLFHRQSLHQKTCGLPSADAQA